MKGTLAKVFIRVLSTLIQVNKVVNPLKAIVIIKTSLVYEIKIHHLCADCNPVRIVNLQSNNDFLHQIFAFKLVLKKLFKNSCSEVIDS